MRVKTIYTRPDGTISGSNEPLPVKPERDESLYNFLLEGQDKLNAYHQALTAWKESCRDFEDQDHAFDFIPMSAMEGHEGERLKTDTIIENVDIETEVVYQRKTDNGWVPSVKQTHELFRRNKLPLSRTVLRIKDKP